jgi:hypothetical protein
MNFFSLLTLDSNICTIFFLLRRRGWVETLLGNGCRCTGGDNLFFLFSYFVCNGIEKRTMMLPSIALKMVGRHGG